MECWSNGKNIDRHFQVDKMIYPQQPDICLPYDDLRADNHIDKFFETTLIHLNSNYIQHSNTPALQYSNTPVTVYRQSLNLAIWIQGPDCNKREQVWPPSN